MDLFTKIKSITSFTESEEIFTQFILNHPYDVIQLSLQQLAKTSYVSISTIYRVMEKLDINGLNQLKLQISESLKNNKDLKEIDYNELRVSEKFTPALYIEKDGVWEGGSTSMFSPVLKFTLFERFSKEYLEVSETMEVRGKRTFGYDEPIIYKRVI